ncbi:MAG: hypothetical protein Q9160_004658 [Pyrenula sp. 1 TL-2023]
MATLIFGGGYLAYKQVKKHRGKKKAERNMIVKTNPTLDTEREKKEQYFEDGDGDVNIDEPTSSPSSPRLTRRTSDEIIHGRIQGLKKIGSNGTEEDEEEERRRRKSEGDQRSTDDGYGWVENRREDLIDFGDNRQTMSTANTQTSVTVVRDDPTGWVDEILQEKELEAARKSVGERPVVRQIEYQY